MFKELKTTKSSLLAAQHDVEKFKKTCSAHETAIVKLKESKKKQESEIKKIRER